MEIHKVVYNSTLQVILYLIDNDLLAHIDQLDVSQVLFFLIDCLIDLFVVSYPVSKVQCRRFWVLAFVIGRCGLDLHNVRHNGLFRVTLGLHIERLDVVGFAALSDPSSSSLCRIGSIQYSHNASIFLEPFEHVFHRGFRCSVPHPLAFLVGGIEEVGSGLWSVLSAVAADIEGSGAYGKPSQVSDDWFKCALSASAHAKTMVQGMIYLSER